MNIYLLHTGYIIGVLAVSIVIGMLADDYFFKKSIQYSESGELVYVYLGMVATILLLLSYY